jgi:hypothetical protein
VGGVEVIDLVPIRQRHLQVCAANPNDPSYKGVLLMAVNDIATLHDELIQVRPLVEALAALDPVDDFGGVEEEQWHCFFCAAGETEDMAYRRDNKAFVGNDHRPDCLWLQAKALVEQ